MTPDLTLAPGIGEFVSRLMGAYAAYPGFDGLDFPEQRRIVEAVRWPWREGGPKIASVREQVFPASGADVRLRIYDPAPGTSKAALVYLHGGGWTYFSLDTHDRLMREYAARGGFVVIGVDYPLAPETKFPTALEQVAELVLWLADHGGQVGVDGRRLAIGGDSAGANIAMAAAIKLRDDGHPRAASALLLNYGVFDSGSSNEAEQTFGGDRFVLSRAEMEAFWRNYLRDPADMRQPLACPIRADARGLPACFFCIPACDILTEQSLAMAAHLRAGGVETVSRMYAGATHSFLEAISIAPVADQALDDAAAWLRARLSAVDAP